MLRSTTRLSSRVNHRTYRPPCTHYPRRVLSSLSKSPESRTSHCKKHSHHHNEFHWRDIQVWKRASANTFRCLVGCSIGDFSSMFLLRHYTPDLPTWELMGISMAAGICTSVALETVALRVQENMKWKDAFTMAINMSFISMLMMEFTANIVDLYLTKGCTDFTDPWFWAAMAPSLVAGFTAPLPYNYYRLKKHNRSCH